MTRRRKWVVRGVAVIVGAGLLLAGGLAFILYPQILKAAPEASYPAPQSLEEANRQDIDFLARLLEIDRTFSPEARAAFSAGIAALQPRAGDLSPAELEMEAARLIALADNGHTNVRGVSQGLTMNALPIRIHRFAEGYFIIRARPELADLLGARIVAIDDRSPETLVKALTPYVGGPPALRQEFATTMLIAPQALAAAGLAERDDRVSLTLQTATGEEVTREVLAEAMPANGPIRDDAALERLRRRHWPARNLSPIASPVDIGDWVTLLDAKGDLPLYLQDPDRLYWSERIRELDALYVQMNAVYDAEEGPPLGAFLQGVIAELKADPARNVIVDLRFNSGGDGTLTSDFTTALPAALPADGRVYILTSGNTFSAAIITAARLKYFAGDRAVILGEPMGDRERFWAEGGRLTLPNSGIQFGYATAAHDWEHGCQLSEIRACYFINYIIGVPAGSLAPDELVVPRFADYAAGEDSALLAIAARQPE